ncbi:MAG: hypothetical protein KJ057_08785 [Phycisphaerae bacterium]|nr:MAG: hypothetical protein F9K17_00315 [Phycisphaerae bacterium]MBE7456140.1 hypothetical protein [Planctomycetia bacterium]MCK6465428.1 hypothetical protein [Phycisphaerae bacterium]MCL4718555.1 hypothetical protein [Phycisphaerae bacterium]NUQ09063.1 hypothetical protein [Phycisphaerae bacterium]
MALTQADIEIINAYRAWIERRVAESGYYGPCERHDRSDGSTLLSRFDAGGRIWLEVGLRPFIPQVRTAIVTDDRWKSEELEEAIESTGDTMSEFLEAGFDEADLDWREPPVEHYRDGGKYFYFATPLELSSLSDLTRDDVRTKTFKMLEGYRIAFGPSLTRRS